MYTEVVANSNTQSQRLRRVPILLFAVLFIILQHRIGVRYPQNSDQHIQLQVKIYCCRSRHTVAGYKIEWEQDEVPLSLCILLHLLLLYYLYPEI